MHSLIRAVALEHCYELLCSMHALNKLLLLLLLLAVCIPGTSHCSHLPTPYLQACHLPCPLRGPTSAHTHTLLTMLQIPVLHNCMQMMLMVVIEMVRGVHVLMGQVLVGLSMRMALCWQSEATADTPHGRGW